MKHKDENKGGIFPLTRGGQTISCQLAIIPPRPRYETGTNTYETRMKHTDEQKVGSFTTGGGPILPARNHSLEAKPGVECSARDMAKLRPDLV
jgi:hypothetical protein